MRQNRIDIIYMYMNMCMYIYTYIYIYICDQTGLIRYNFDIKYSLWGGFDKIIGLFCKRAPWKRLYFAEET